MPLPPPISPIRLIAIDLDGTLLTSDRQIHPENFAAISRAVGAGISVVLASGRIRPSIAPFSNELNLPLGPLICSNGAHIVGVDGHSLIESHLSADIRGAVITFAVKEKLHLNGYSTDAMYYIQDDSWSELYKRRAKTIPSHLVEIDTLRSMNLIKLMVVGEPSRIRSIAGHGGEYFDLTQVALTESEPEYLEFLPFHANKGDALAKLCDHLGVNRKNVMAIGDYLNDIEMVSWAGHGIAMGNAVPEVKARAIGITANNDEGGVAIAIASVLQ